MAMNRVKNIGIFCMLDDSCVFFFRRGLTFESLNFQ